MLLACAVLVPSALSLSAPALAEGSASGNTAARTAPSAPAAPAASPAWANAYARGQWRAAVELLETLPEASRTAWHWLHLARAREKLGQLVESFAAYERLLDVASDAPGAPGMKDVQKQAQAESAVLAHRIPWAQVTLASNVPLGGLVYVDQQWLAPERLRLPYPVNPGWHTFLVESNGQVLAARRAHFEEGQTRLVPLASFEGSAPPNAALGGAGSEGAPGASRSIDDDPWGIDSATSTWGTPATPPVASSAGAGKAPASASRSAESAPSAADAPSRPAAARALTWHAPAQAADKPTDGLLTSAYVSLGIGAAGALVGTAFAIAAHDARDQANFAYANCFDDSCFDDDAANSQWRRRATIAGASYAIGLIGLVTGGILWLAHREYSSSSKATLRIANVELELEPGLRPDGAYLRGKF